MGEVGSQTLGTFVIGENAVNTSVIAHSSVSQSTAETTGNALQKKLTLGNFSVSEKSIGTPLTKSRSEVESPTATVNTSSTSESITSTSTTSQAESNLFIGERTLGNESLGTPLNSETSSTGDGIPTQSVTTSRTVEPTLEVVITADVTTLATTSALASSASTETVAGETLTVALSGLTSGTDNATTAGALFSNTALTPRLSPSVSKSTDGSITGSTTETTVADSIAQAIDGLIASLSTTENVGTGTTDTISNPQKGIASSNALISPTDNSVTAKAFESLLRVGGFVIGSTGFGDSLEAQNSAVGPLIAEGDSGITGVGKPSQSRTTAVLADSVSRGSGGITTGVQSVSSGSVPATTTSSSVNLQTLAPTTILGSSGNTVAVAGEKLKTTFSGTIDTVDTEASSESLITPTVGDSLLSGSLSQSSGGAVQSAESTSSVADSISEAINGITTRLSTTIEGGTALTSTLSDASMGVASPNTLVPITDNSVLATAFGSTFNTGDYRLGNGELGTVKTTQSVIGSGVQPELISTTTAEGSLVSVSETSRLSESISSGSGGEITNTATDTFSGTATTTTVSSANLQTLVPATVLAATADTLAVGGETVRLDTGTFTSPVLSESEAVSPTTLSSTTDAIGAGTTDTTSPALVKESVGSATVSEPSTETLSIAQVLSESVNSLLSNSVSSSVSESELQSSSTTVFQDGSLSSSTATVDEISEELGTTLLGEESLGTTGASQQIEATEVDSTGSTESISESIISPGTGTTATSPVFSEAIGGLVANGLSSGTLGEPTTSTVVPAINETFAPATVLAASGNSFAVGGETIKLNMSGVESPVLSESNSVSKRALALTGVNATTEITETTSPALETLFSGATVQSDVFSETTSESQLTNPSGVGLLSDSVATSLGGTRQSSTASGIEDGSFSTTESLSDVQPFTGSPSLTSNIAKSVSESTIVSGSVASLFSESISEATGGIPTLALSEAGTGIPSTRTKTSADNQTLVPGTVLGASADTFAVGGETITVNGSPLVSPVLSETLSDAVETTSGVSPIQSPVLSESLSESTLTAFSGSVKGSSVLSESIGGLIENIQSDPSISQADATTVSEALLQEPDIVTKTIDPNTETIGQGFRLLGLGGGVNVGEFEVGGGLTTQKAIGTSTDTDSDAKATPEVQPTNSIGEPLFSDSVSKGIGGIITPSISETFSGDSLSESVSGDIQTLVPGTVLGASADTFAVGGETVTLNGTPVISPVLSETTSAGSRAASVVSSVQSPVLSKSLSESVTSSLSGSVKRSAVLSESIGGLIQDLQSDPSVSQADTVTVSDALSQEPNVLPTTVDPDTETVGQSFRLLGLGDKANIGNFKLGEGPTTQTAIGTSTDSVPEAKATPRVQPTKSLGDSLFSDSVSQGIGGTITPSTSGTFLADSQSDSTGGVVQTLFGEGGVGIPFTETDSDGDLSTLVSGTVLASTADTEAVAGETVSLLFSPFDAIVDSKATSESPISTVNSAISLSESESFATADSIEALLSSFGLSSTANTTTVSDSITSLSSGLGPEVDPFTETTGIAPPPIIRVGSEDVSGFRLGKSNRANQTIKSSSVQVDADTASQSESEITASSLETLLSPSVSASSGGTITTVGSTIFLAQVDATAESDGTVATLVPATVLAATADTAASGGETLTLTLKPITVDPDTNSISEVPALTDISTAPQLDFGLAESTSETPPTPIEPTIPTVDAFTQTTALGEKLTSVYNPLTVDPETFAQADVPELTTASLSTILAQSLAESTAEVTPTPLSMIPFEAFRFLPDWAISPGPKVIETTIEETRTFTEMTLEFAADTELLTNNLRPQIQNSGKLEIVSDTDGGFTTVDLASGTNRIELFPPTNHELVRPVDEWFIADFSEEPLGTSGSSFDVELIVVPDKEKAFDNEYGTLDEKIEETRGQNEFLFEFFHGDVSTRRVTSDVEKTREGAIDTAELTMILTAEEARIIEESVSKLNAVKEIDVPDGDGSVRDTNSESRNTVNVTVPDAASDTLQSGEYVVTEWESVWTRGLSQEFTITLKK